MRTVRASLGGLAFRDPIEAIEERWYEGVREDWWHQAQMELILGGSSGEGGEESTSIQGFESAKLRNFELVDGGGGNPGFKVLILGPLGPLGTLAP